MKSLEEIEQIRIEKRKELDLRVNTKADTREKHILVCHGTGCTSSKSPQILENFRKTDMVFRYGGEEIVVILTETPSDKAIIPLERLRKAIENYPFYYDGNSMKITISIGVEGLKEEILTPEEFLDNADKSLYIAKERGRNQVVTSSSL